MKKFFVFSWTMIVSLIILCVNCFAAVRDIEPVKLIEITGLDYPYEYSRVLDTSVDISKDSHSNFENLKWTKTEDGLHKVTIKTSTSYYTYKYDENTKATINGKEATIAEFDKDKNRYISFSYVFPKDDSVSNPSSLITLTHVIQVMKPTNGRIVPDFIRARHKQDFTVQIIPDEGYKIADVIVDGESVGAVSEYTFRRVTTTHKIRAEFEPIKSNDTKDETNKEKFEIEFEDRIEIVDLFIAIQMLITNMV